jgi:putative flippase GtrA
MSSLLSRVLVGEEGQYQFLRFLIVGASNTILSSLLYIGLLSLTSHTLSYVLAYLAGTLYSGAVNSKFTFTVSPCRSRLIRFVFFYIGMYCINAVILELAVRYTSIGELLAIVVVIIFSVPIGFIGSRLILSTPADRKLWRRE